MTRARKLILALLLVSAIGAGGAYWFLSGYDDREPSKLVYAEHCAGCHGGSLEGADHGPALVGRTLSFGETTPQLIASLKAAHSETSPNSWEQELPPSMTKALALYVSEQRQGIPTIANSHRHHIPGGVIRSQYHNFRVELVTEVGSGPYSMAPLPDGRILVSQKVRGLSIVDERGKQGPIIEGTPRVWEEILQVRGSYVGLGMMLDVELHPDYANNGWIYLSHADRCQLDCGSVIPVTMVRVVRGRIRDNLWVDTEVIWAVNKDNYTVVPDGVAGGRLAFDKDGYVYVTVGGKSTYDNLHNLDRPYGKIHRVRDDGQVPEDNPFWLPIDERADSSDRHTVWSYGHRTTQGLTAHPVTGAIWSSEMGPRGGDEINLIQRGGNYGWPLYTNGLDYDGNPISIGEDLGLTFAKEDTVSPVVDFTPAPSLSNLTFHNGNRFPGWGHDLLVGSLRAQTLFRVRVEEDRPDEIEKLLTGLGRIRDIEMGADGLVYVLLEHGQSGSLLRLVPAD